MAMRLVHSQCACAWLSSLTVFHTTQLFPKPKVSRWVPKSKTPTWQMSTPTLHVAKQCQMLHWSVLENTRGWALHTMQGSRHTQTQGHMSSDTQGQVVVESTPKTFTSVEFSMASSNLVSHLYTAAGGPDTREERLTSFASDYCRGVASSNRYLRWRLHTLVSHDSWGMWTVRVCTSESYTAYFTQSWVGTSPLPAQGTNVLVLGGIYVHM